METLTPKQISIIAAAIVVVGGGAWLYKSSADKKNERAETAYYDALRVSMSGNSALALSDLKKVATRYNGTNAGISARLAAVRILYDEGKYDEGIAELKQAKPTDPFETSVNVLAAAGYEQLGKFNEAAKEYETAAGKAKFEEEKANHKADAARAYMAAGNKDKAMSIWKELVANPDSPVAPEAAVRLGELTAQVATKG